MLAGLNAPLTRFQPERGYLHPLFFPFFIGNTGKPVSTKMTRSDSGKLSSSGILNCQEHFRVLCRNLCSHSIVEVLKGKKADTAQTLGVVAGGKGFEPLSQAPEACALLKPT